MRKSITIAFVLIFSIFLVGSGITVYNLVKTTGKLKSLIGLHEIEDIRQELFSSVLSVSAYVFSTPEVFNEHLDEIIENTNSLHTAIRRCHDCHHEPGVLNELKETQQQVDHFEQQLSYLITIISAPDRRLAQQEEVYSASREIINRVQKMVNKAATTIDSRTVAAMNELNRVYGFVAMTILSTIILSIIVAYYLIRKITEPIDSLLNSTRKITGGQWGHQADYKTTGEFQELIDAFNQMSESLAAQRSQEQLHLKEIQDTQKQLIEAEKLTALGTMAGGIAHDFNNILCGMIGHLNILARQIPQDEAHLNIIHTVEKAGFRAADLVKQLLTFARQKPMELQTVNINNCIDDVVQLIGHTLDKRIKLNLDLTEPLPSVLGDPAQLEQVVVNLCVNSRDAMPEGGEISLRTEIFDADEEFCSQHRDASSQQYVLMTVKDTGCGINAKILPRIFDPFFTTKEVGKGTGLGLAMVYGIVKNHNGFCTLESIPGKGTSIKVYLPSIEQLTKEPLQQRQLASPTDKTILIVDDEPMVLEMLKKHLESLGCRVLSATDGQMGVDMFREKKDEIDLIILDINMPIMCGRDAYQQFIRIKPDVLVLVSTGYVMSEDTKELLDMGAQGFLQKPYAMEDINAKIMEILAHAERE